jgi:hypothetical protein
MTNESRMVRRLPKALRDDDWKKPCSMGTSSTAPFGREINQRELLAVLGISS